MCQLWNLTSCYKETVCIHSMVAKWHSNPIQCQSKSQLLWVQIAAESNVYRLRTNNHPSILCNYLAMEMHCRTSHCCELCCLIHGNIDQIHRKMMAQQLQEEIGWVGRACLFCESKTWSFYNLLWIFWLCAYFAILVFIARIVFGVVRQHPPIIFAPDLYQFSAIDAYCSSLIAEFSFLLLLTASHSSPEFA